MILDKTIMYLLNKNVFFWRYFVLWYVFITSVLLTEIDFNLMKTTNFIQDRTEENENTLKAKL